MPLQPNGSDVPLPIVRGGTPTPAAPAAPTPALATPAAAPAAAPAAPAAALPEVPRRQYTGGPPAGSVQGVQYSTEQQAKLNDMDREAILKPLRESQVKNANLVPEIDKTLNTVNSGKFGPGTSLKQLALEAKGTFTNLSPAELKQLTDTKTLDSTAKKLILADTKGSLPGSISDSDRNYLDKTGASINDTKDFIRAQLELKKATFIANKDLANYLSKPENAGNISEAYQAYQDSGRGMAILRQNAPTLFKYENKAASAPSAATQAPAQKSAWLNGQEIVVAPGGKSWIYKATGKPVQ